MHTNYNCFIELILMSTLNVPLFNRRSKRHPELSPLASLPGPMTKPQWLELPMSRTDFHGPNDAQAIIVWPWQQTRSSGILFGTLVIVFSDTKIKGYSESSLGVNHWFPYSRLGVNLYLTTLHSVAVKKLWYWTLLLIFHILKDSLQF